MTVDDGEAGRRVRVWDAPVRIVHWSFVVLIPLLWWTWKSGRMDLHVLLGCSMLGLVLFRLFWGFYGSATARFDGFVRSPATVLTYLKEGISKPAKPVVGHNPLGGWSVMILLGLLSIQVMLGLIAQDIDGVVSGPLSHYVTFEVADLAREIHGTAFYAILSLVTVHIVAILYYRFSTKDDLISPMISGERSLPHHVAAPAQVDSRRIVVGVSLTIMLVWWIASGARL